MKFIETDTLTEAQKLGIIALWNTEYPKALFLPSLVKFDQYLDSLTDRHHILLLDENEKLYGWFIYFIREEERWFAMILDSSLQGQGWGSKFLKLAKKRNTELNGWVIDNDKQPKQNGEYYRSPINFYLKNGFAIQAEVQLKKKNIQGIKVVWSSDWPK